MKLFTTLAQALALLASAALLAACAQLGLQKAQSPEDNLRYAQAGVSAGYKTVGDLKAAGSITTEEGVSMFKRLEAVEKDLALAEPLLKGPQASTAIGKIDLALKALLVIQGELRAREGKKVSLAPLALNLQGA